MIRENSDVEKTRQSYKQKDLERNLRDAFIQHPFVKHEDNSRLSKYGRLAQRWRDLFKKLS